MSELSTDIFLLLLGVVLGIVINDVFTVGEKVRSWKKRLSDKVSKKDLFGYDCEADNLMMINRWSLHRPLKKSNHRVIVQKEHPPQVFIPSSSFKEYLSVQKAQKKSGNICFLTDYQIDHHESRAGKEFTVTISPCDYSEHMATSAYLKDNPDVKEKIRALFETDPKLYFQNAIPSNITVNVVVLSESNFLAVKRSKSVDTARNIWTVGVFETMTLQSDLSPGSEEDFFSLSKRCLKEELGLDENHYGEIFISWFGFLLSIARTHIVAVVKIKGVSENEVINLANSHAHSNFESESFEWLPLNKVDVKNFIVNDTGRLTDKAWISFAKLSLCEALRVREVL